MTNVVAGGGEDLPSVVSDDIGTAVTNVTAGCAVNLSRRFRIKAGRLSVHLEVVRREHGEAFCWIDRSRSGGCAGSGAGRAFRARQRGTLGPPRGRIAPLPVTWRQLRPLRSGRGL